MEKIWDMFSTWTHTRILSETYANTWALKRNLVQTRRIFMNIFACFCVASPSWCNKRNMYMVQMCGNSKQLIFFYLNNHHRTTSMERKNIVWGETPECETYAFKGQDMLCFHYINMLFLLLYSILLIRLSIDWNTIVLSLSHLVCC